MLSVAVFGVTSELDDEEYFTGFGFCDGYFMGFWLSRQKRGAARLNIPKEHPKRPRSAVAFEYTALPLLDEFPRWVRWWEAHRKRRKKCTSVKFTEFADLSDGRRVTVQSVHGFDWSWKHLLPPCGRSIPESLADEVRSFFMRNEAANVEEGRPCTPEWVVERLHRLYGIEIDPASVQAALRAPLRIEFGPRLRQLLQQLQQ